MADFTALKTAIQNAIKQNGNEEITGNLLQEVLLAIVTTLGDGSINDLITALGSEATTRGNADTTLQQNIGAEAQARQQAVSAEAQARGDADTALGGRIDGVVSSIEAINNAIGNGYVYAGIATPSSIPTTGKVFYLALTGGTYTNFGNIAVTQGINILKYNGSTWSLDAFVGIDDTPTPSSNNLVKSGGVFNDIMTNGSAFDLSAYNNGTTYADLNAALTALNALPAAYKKGGMSMKFVLSSDNNYVKFFCTAKEFTTDVTKWQGVDKELSENSRNLIENKPVASAIQKIKNTYSNKEDDLLYIVDALGHIVAQVDKDGIKAINLIKDNAPTEGSDNYVKSGGVYDAILNAINIAIHNTSGLSSEDNTLYVADANGYVVMKVDKDGLKIINQFDNSILYKKKIIGVGDSLSVDGNYEKELCRLGNAIYGGVYSAGGTNTLPNNLNSSQDRIKELIENDVDFDILLFENINDRWRAFMVQDGHHIKKGSISDNSFMLSQYINDTNVYATLQEAQNGFISDFSTIVAGVSDKKAGSVIQVEYQTETIVLSVNSAATSNGDIQVIVGENTCNVSVTAGMSANTIAYLIGQYNFEGYEVQRSNNTVTLYLKSGYTISTPTFNMGSTGVTMSYTNGTSSGHYRRFFTGYSSAEFVDIDNWSNDLSLYSLYKGIIEYIQKNRPQAKIVFFAPSIWGELPQTSIPSSLTNSDGSYNITKILASDYKTYIFTDNKYLREIQKECAELYGCKFIDAMVEGGISPFNISEYYNSNNVHPKDIKAYNIWGSLLFNKLN